MMINKEKSLFKKILPHIGAILCFLVITLIYFSPLLEGKVLPQGDVHQFEGMSHELSEYYHTEGGSSAWTGSMFSGMPSYQIGVWGGANPNLVSYLEMPLHWVGDTNAGPVFAGMLMAYILFLIMGFGILPAFLGAIAYAFSSYNIIIIDAGHVTKAWTIAYIPLVIAGIFSLFRKKYILGGLLMALGLCLQIKNNHLQITYYTGLLCAILYIGFLVKTLMKKDVKSLLKVSGVVAIAVIVAVLCNLSSIYTNYEMAEESTRGKSELSQPSETQKQSSGLDKGYAFAWSYGKAETMSLLIPNIHGGASGGTVDATSNLAQQLKIHGAQVPADGIQTYTYWGDQPFTSGPVYFGAIICFLFVLGMIIIRSRMKWVLLAATVFFVFLSWGRNFELFNDFFFYHFPFYNKFRTVSMALVIPALTMVIVAVWGIKEFFGKEFAQRKQFIALCYAGGTTAFICLFFWLMPDFFFNFTVDIDAKFRSQMPDWYYSALLQDRKELLSGDALRSFWLIVLASLVLLGTTKWKTLLENRKTAMICGVSAIIVLVLVDLWNVDKRYLNDKNFQNKISYQGQKFPMSEADKMILTDKSPSYRVLNMSNPFNESNTSYYHKSIGGYHAAKLKRYQELTDHRLMPEIMQIVNSFDSQNMDTIMMSFQNTTALNMLNARYIIYNPEQPPLVNPYSLGNAWFVSDYSFVANADEEIVALNSLNPSTTAVVDKRFEQELAGMNISADSTATIEMTLYKPSRVVYKSNAQSEQLAVFSENYYDKGWEAYVDGKFTPHFRADWTLRAMRIPAGEHEIEFKFVPHTYYMTRTVSSVSSGLLILVLLGGIVMLFRKKEEETEK